MSISICTRYDVLAYSAHVSLSPEGGFPINCISAPINLVLCEQSRKPSVDRWNRRCKLRLGHLIPERGLKSWTGICARFLLDPLVDTRYYSLVTENTSVMVDPEGMGLDVAMVVAVAAIAMVTDREA